MKLPCLLTIEKDACTPRLPSYKRKLETNEDLITVYSSQDLTSVDPSRCGLKGSPTQVERIFPPEAGGEREIFQGDSGHLCETLFSILSSGKYV